MTVGADEVRKLKRQREEVKAKLSSVGDRRPGSLVGRYRKCGKANRHCAAAGETGHGPSWSLTRDLQGKTVTRVIPAGAAVERTREQLDEHRRFRAWSRELVEISEKLCDAQLQTPGAASDEAAKKGGSKRPSRPKSSPRSRRS